VVRKKDGQEKKTIKKDKDKGKKGSSKKYPFGRSNFERILRATFS